MKQIDWAGKLTSRKFWAAIASFVSMLIIAFHGAEETATQIAALIMAGASVVAYIVGEGLADAAGAHLNGVTYWTSGYAESDDVNKPPEESTENAE